jgi:trans-2,3-dihydro-3-hydroxyanthranilate isomerase
MRAYEFETCDVFTDRKFAGNQLAVVMDAAGLSTDEMQAITREFNLSETTFVLPPDDVSNTARVRIFTVGYEMPFAGHPTVGTAIAIARARRVEGDIRLELKTGLFPVRVDFSGAAPYAEFQNPNLPKEMGAAPSAAALDAALSLPAGSIDNGAHAPRLIGAGVDFIYARAPLDVVRAAQVNTAAWAPLSTGGVVGVYLYAKGGNAPDADCHARMFAPDAGIVEDPATGSAAAAFPGQIALSENLTDGEHRWIVEQGFEMGRPSRIQAIVAVAEGVVQSVRIGGNAIPVQKGQIFV